MVAVVVADEAAEGTVAAALSALAMRD